MNKGMGTLTKFSILNAAVVAMCFGVSIALGIGFWTAFFAAVLIAALFVVFWRSDL